MLLHEARQNRRKEPTPAERQGQPALVGVGDLEPGEPARSLGRDWAEGLEDVSLARSALEVLDSYLRRC